MDIMSLLKAGAGAGAMGATGGMAGLALPLGGAAIGAGIGALVNKKDRLGGALGGGLIGGGLGYTAGKKGLMGKMGALGGFKNLTGGAQGGMAGGMPTGQDLFSAMDPGQKTMEFRPLDNVLSDIPTGYNPAKASSDPYFQDFLKDPMVLQMLMNSGYGG